MDTHLPFVRQRETTGRRPVTSRPPAPPRPLLREPPVDQQSYAEPMADPTMTPTTAPTTMPTMAPGSPAMTPTASAPPTTIVQNVTAAPAAGTAGATGTVTTGGYIAPDAIITSIVGGLILALGLVTLARLGLGGSVLQPVDDILGIRHTPLLGLVEVGVGLLFVILGVLAARSASIVLGALVAVAGAIVVIGYQDFDADLALTRDLGWWMIGAGVLVVLANLLLPGIATRTTESDTF